MLSMYLLGIVAAFAMAWIFKKTLLRGETPMLLLEMPPYRMPDWKSVSLRMWERGVLFLRRAGGRSGRLLVPQFSGCTVTPEIHVDVDSDFHPSAKAHQHGYSNRSRHLTS